MPSATLSMTVTIWNRFREYKKSQGISTDGEAITKLLDKVMFLPS